MLVNGAAQEPEHLPGRARVEVAGRLIGEDQLGPAISARATSHTLLLAAGELARRCDSRSAIRVLRRDSRTTRCRSCTGQIRGQGDVSPAVSVGTRLNDWNTKPISSRRQSVRPASSSRSISWPPTNERPDVGESRPAMQCISVDLPDPDGPHHRGEATTFELDVHTVQCPNGRIALAIRLRQLDGARSR